MMEDSGARAHKEQFELARKYFVRASEAIEDGLRAGGAELAKLFVDALPEHPKE
jgi:hypothetical protein